jgi:hypothetical protein
MVLQRVTIPFAQGRVGDGEELADVSVHGLVADSLMPNVGQRGGLSSFRSKTVTGKFCSSPPSTQVQDPSGVGW